ncbi:MULTISPECIES: hypothetical protein [unclassified Bradyrhizobium]|uniref:hypothetical protein n=1 Tax=Bradyrhizobium sp. 183 TaxID=2782652 RepID=UPI001FFEB62F|nr:MULTISPECIES: hypothetical protein [unclassified Bradyrhizobium]
MPSDLLESVFNPHASSHDLSGAELIRLPLNALMLNQKDNCNTRTRGRGQSSTSRDHHADDASNEAAFRELDMLYGRLFSHSITYDSANGYGTTYSAGDSSGVQRSSCVRFIMMAATILLFQIPTMASTLAGASVAAVGAGAAVAAASIAKREMMRCHVNAQGLRDTVTAAAARVSPAKAALPAINAMRQSAGMRQRRQDERVARRTAEQLST